MTAPALIEWVLVSISNLVHATCIVVLLYWVCRFQRYRKHQALQKRYPWAVHLITICAIMYLLQHLTYKLTFIHEADTLQMSDSHPNTVLLFMNIFSDFCYAFSVHGIFAVLIARTWMIYFNIHWGLQTQNMTWMVHIDPTLASSSFWFIKHKKDFGSVRHIKLTVLCYYLIEGSIIFVGLLFFPNIEASLDACLYFIELVILTVIWTRIPSMHDPFRIKGELKRILHLGGVGLVMYVTYMVVDFTCGRHLVSFIVMQCMFGLVVASIALVTTLYVFVTDESSQLLGDERHSVSSPETPVTPNSPSNGSSQKRSGKYKLQEVLREPQLVGCLFNHLLDEFSVELLLAFIEISQFENMMSNDDEFMHVIDDFLMVPMTQIILQKRYSSTYSNSVILGDNLPQSGIVHTHHVEVTDAAQRYLLIAQDLSDKFIDSSAEFQINTSSECRQNIVHFLHKHLHSGCVKGDLSTKEKHQLFTLFAEAKRTVLSLLLTAHRRCRRADRYTPRTE